MGRQRSVGRLTFGFIFFFLVLVFFKREGRFFYFSGNLLGFEYSEDLGRFVLRLHQTVEDSLFRHEGCDFPVFGEASFVSVGSDNAVGVFVLLHGVHGVLS